MNKYYDIPSSTLTPTGCAKSIKLILKAAHKQLIKFRKDKKSLHHEHLNVLAEEAESDSNSKYVQYLRNLKFIETQR